LSKVAEELQRRFPPETGVRVAADARTSQIVVAAPEETQVRITQLLRDAAQPQTAPPAAPATTKPGAGYALQNITVQELEDGLLRIWGQRLTRTVSPNGETVVLHVAAESGAQPVLHIDRRAGSVAFLTTPGATPVWQRVIEALDRPRGGANPETELVPVQRADPAKVQRAVELLQSSMEAAPAGAPTRLASAPLPQEAAPATAPADAAPPPAAPPVAAPEANGTAVLPVGEEGGLLGPVQIEFLEGLDVIVLRGHKRDVERVQRIIGDIERLSVETQPQIELIHLAHVGSQAMNELVGDIYNEILSPRQGQVTIRALVKPNSLLLIGRPESVNVVR